MLHYMFNASRQPRSRSKFPGPPPHGFNVSSQSSSSDVQTQTDLCVNKTPSSCPLLTLDDQPQDLTNILS